jgi:hypothetical protein
MEKIIEKIRVTWQSIRKCYNTVFTPVSEIKEAFAKLSAELKEIWKTTK